MVNGQDKVAHTAQYSGYLHEGEGCAGGVRFPPDGVVAAPQPWGIVDEAPHPAAAQLFMDWFLGVPGQTINVQSAHYHSPRSDVPPPPGGVSINNIKLLTPTDWHGIREDPRAIRARMGQDHRPALNGYGMRSIQGISLRNIVMPLMVLLCGALVLYPVVFLINESLNIGDPSAFPPEEYGFDNYFNMIDDYHVLANTALVSCIATVMAVIFGFLLAWILTRTNILAGSDWSG